MNLIRKYLRRYARDELGATAMEFSILAVPLFVGIFAIIEMGYKSMLQSELDDRLYAVSSHIGINAVDYDDADEFMREYFCPELGSTFLRCEDITFGALVLTERFYKYRSRPIAGTWNIGCPGEPILIELNYPVGPKMSPIELADVVERNGQKFYRSRTVITREPMLSGGGSC